MLCKTRLGIGAATDWAQGGIAAAMGKDDSPRLHAIDTQRAGAGISDEKIVEILTQDAPARIEDLLELGAAFDRTKGGELALGREAAHQRRRIVKAGGDATGHEILKTLIHAVRTHPSIAVVEEVTADDLIVEDDRVLWRLRARRGRKSCRLSFRCGRFGDRRQSDGFTATRPIRFRLPATESPWRRAPARS